MMAAITKKFIFPNQAQALFTSLRQILNFVSAQLPLNADAASINFKLKVIITELLNNAVKHVGNAETTIEINMDKQAIHIKKIDLGSPYSPNKSGSLSGASVGEKVLLSQDFLHRVYAAIEQENFVRFSCEDNDEAQSPDINNLSEHFGLLIISKSADEFTYSYDQSAGLNTFAASVKF